MDTKHESPVEGNVEPFFPGQGKLFPVANPLRHSGNTEMETCRPHPTRQQNAVHEMQQTPRRKYHTLPVELPKLLEGLAMGQNHSSNGSVLDCR
jgi:hypothetical protein